MRCRHDGLLLSQDPFILSSIIFDLPCERTGVTVTICINALDRVIRLDHAVIVSIFDTRGNSYFLSVDLMAKRERQRLSKEDQYRREAPKPI